MQTQQEENSLLDQVVRVLYYPIPFLPSGSLIARARAQGIKRNALNNLRNTPGSERKLRGKLHLISKSRFEICEHVVEFNEHTWIFGNITEGAVAEVTIKQKAGIYQASRVVIVD